MSSVQTLGFVEGQLTLERFANDWIKKLLFERGSLSWNDLLFIYGLAMRYWMIGVCVAFFPFFKFMCLRQGRIHPFWNRRSNSSDSTTQETADWEWWTLKWLEVFKSCAYANLNVVGTNDESRFILIKPVWQARARTWYAPYIHSYVRPVYQPLFGKWARAPPSKRRIRESGGNRAYSSV